jgi:hypothetical protein
MQSWRSELPPAPFLSDEDTPEVTFERVVLRDDEDMRDYVEDAENELLDRAAKRALLPIKPRRPR